MHGVNMATGNRIKELREEKGFKRSKVAAAFDVDQSTIYRWEHSGPPTHVIPELAQLLEAEPAYLMGWTDQEAA